MTRRISMATDVRMYLAAMCVNAPFTKMTMPVHSVVIVDQVTLFETSTYEPSFSVAEEEFDGMVMRTDNIDDEFLMNSSDSSLPLDDSSEYYHFRDKNSYDSSSNSRY